MKRIRVYSAGKDLPAWGDYCIVCPGKAGNAVQKDHDIPPVLHKALGLLNHHLGNLNVAGSGLIKSGTHYLTVHGALHIRDFLGSLVN